LAFVSTWLRVAHTTSAVKSREDGASAERLPSSGPHGGSPSRRSFEAVSLRERRAPSELRASADRPSWGSTGPYSIRASSLIRPGRSLALSVFSFSTGPVRPDGFLGGLRPLVREERQIPCQSSLPAVP